MIAEDLGLPNPQHYTGHCMRRSSITTAADKGLSLPQIKAISGHKSDNVVQSYISKSDAQRTLAANALSLDVSKPHSQKAGSSAGSLSVAGRIRELAALFHDDFITEDVYNAKRQKLEDLL